jgi:hypothetical protein
MITAVTTVLLSHQNLHRSNLGTTSKLNWSSFLGLVSQIRSSRRFKNRA